MHPREPRTKPARPATPPPAKARPPKATRKVLKAVAKERERQEAKWGHTEHPLTPSIPMVDLEKTLWDARATVHECTVAGALTWWHLLDEEIAEARCEAQAVVDLAFSDMRMQRARRFLREELVQCMAVLAAMVEQLDAEGQPGQVVGRVPM
jgi:hypothetical protein